jgi:DNA-directed RNA polymerase specialized sigma24 family protein
MSDLTDLYQNYGTLIKRVSRQVAYESNTRYGYDIVSHADLAQEVFIKLAADQIDLGTLREPQGWIRQTARIKALDHIYETLGRRAERRGHIVEPADLSAPAMVNRHASQWGHPEAELAYEESIRACQAVISAIIAKVRDPDQRDAIEAFYLRGDGGDNASEKRRSRAEKGLPPEDIASLRVWRTWTFPELRNRPPTTEATPLLAALLS